MTRRTSHASRSTLVGALGVAITAACACNTVPRVVDNPNAPAPPQEKAIASVDFAKAGDEAFDDLRTYLMADTTNPPRADGTGGEKAGALVLKELLAKDGIESELWPVGAASVDETNRVTLVARLQAEHATQGPLCLVSHLDVVTAEPSRWPAGKGPFAGFVEEKDGDKILWGRGALDMKGMGLVETEVMRWLKRTNAKLDRDVILLAVADEEVNSAGMRDAIEHHWDQLGCTQSVNEGGMGLRDAIVDGQTVFPISVGEKGVVWVKMIAEGPPGHGSTPVEGRAPGKLLAAMDRIRARVDKPRLDPELYELLYDVGSEAGGLTGFVMTKHALVDAIVVDRFMQKPITRAIITNTVNLTGFAGAHEPNVVPSEVWAQYDVRLLPGTTPDDAINELKALTAGIDGIRFEVMQHAMLAAVSDWDDSFYRALAHQAVAVAEAHGEKRVVAGPILSPGFTDSVFLRGKGVHAYGFVPFIVTGDEMGTMHGDGEHVSKKNVVTGVETLLRAVVDVSVAP